MRRYLIMPALILAAGTCVSCVTSGNPALQREELVSQIKIGQSTKEDVRRLFGPPNVVSRSSDSLLPGVVEIWGYSYLSVETHSATFIPVIGLFAGSATAETSSLTVQFDEKGIVRHITTSQTKAEGGPGASSPN